MVKSPIMLVSILMSLTSATWVDVCASDFGGHCCAPGMETREYMFREVPASWREHEGFCVDDQASLVVFESWAERDCLVQYLTDNHNYDRYPYNWAIGLASTHGHRGVYRWLQGESMDYNTWAVGAPGGLECVSLNMSEPHHGAWQDITCGADTDSHLVLGLCERSTEPTTTSTAAPTTSTSTTAAPTTTTCGCVTLLVKVLNSENNLPVTSARVSITAPDGSSVGDNVQVNTDGIAQFHSCQIGTFSVHVESDGFIPADTSIEVGCEQADFTVERLVSISPELEAGETRIIMSWETESPSDVDIHVISVRNSDQTTCRTYYSNKNGCNMVSQDVDNTHGGNNGAETVTLLDNSINKDYTYLIGIEDYQWNGHGETDLLQSGSKITLTNGVTTEVDQMVGSSITYPNEFYFFGCLTVTEDGQFTFSRAPDGTFFDGNTSHPVENWIYMMEHYC